MSEQTGKSPGQSNDLDKGSDRCGVHTTRYAAVADPTAPAAKRQAEQENALQRWETEGGAKRVQKKGRKTGQTAMRSRRSGGRTPESRMDDVPTDSRRREREEPEERRTRGRNRGKLAAWARWLGRDVRLDSAHPMADTNHGRQHLLIVHLPSPCPLNRDDLPKQSRRFIIELDPVLDPPHPCVRPITIPACLVCHACHNALLSCAHSSVAGGALSLQMRPCRPIPPAAPSLRRRKHRPVVITSESSYRSIVF